MAKCDQPLLAPAGSLWDQVQDLATSYLVAPDPAPQQGWAWVECLPCWVLDILIEEYDKPGEDRFVGLPDVLVDQILTRLRLRPTRRVWALVQ